MEQNSYCQRDRGGTRALVPSPCGGCCHSRSADLLFTFAAFCGPQKSRKSGARMRFLRGDSRELDGTIRHTLAGRAQLPVAGPASER